MLLDVVENSNCIAEHGMVVKGKGVGEQGTRPTLAPWLALPSSALSDLLESSVNSKPLVRTLGSWMNRCRRTSSEKKSSRLQFEPTSFFGA